MINKEPTKIALLGAGCSLVSERIAEEAKTWNLLMVSKKSTDGWDHPKVTYEGLPSALIGENLAKQTILRNKTMSDIALNTRIITATKRLAF